MLNSRLCVTGLVAQAARRSAATHRRRMAADGAKRLPLHQGLFFRDLSSFRNDFPAHQADFVLNNRERRARIIIQGKDMNTGKLGSRLLALFLLLNSVAAFAGLGVWTTNGPEGGPIRSIAVDPNNPSILYVGTVGAEHGGGGVFKSINKGLTWTPVNNGLTFMEV